MEKIRKAEISDTSEVLKTDPLACEPSRVDFVRSSIERGECYLCSREDQICGYGILNYTFFGSGFIALLNVHPEFRRQQIGTALMRHLENHCSHSKLFTSTNESNIAMQQLLSSLNYSPSGRVENLDEGDPELIYFKALP